MVKDIIQTAVSAFDGVTFDGLAHCPFCGGMVQGYDFRYKKFAVFEDAGCERAITVRVKRFTCRSCKKLCYADEPFYPETRIGSLLIDLYFTLSSTMPRSRAARVIGALGFRIDRSTWRNYHDRGIPAVPATEVFGIQVPISVISLSTLAARTPEGSRIKGTEALAACGFPSAYRAAPDRLPPLEQGDERKKEEDKKERQSEHP